MQEGQHRRQIQRRAIAQAQCQFAARHLGTLLAQCRGRHAAALQEGRIEAAQAVEAGSERDLGDRQGGFGQQLLGQQQPMRAVHLDRRGTQLLHELPLQLARAHAHRIGQRLHRLRLQRAVGNHRQRTLHAFFAQMLLRLRRQLRPAAQAWPAAVG